MIWMKPECQLCPLQKKWRKTTNQSWFEWCSLVLIGSKLDTVICLQEMDITLVKIKQLEIAENGPNPAQKCTKTLMRMLTRYLVLMYCLTEILPVVSEKKPGKFFWQTERTSKYLPAYCMCDRTWQQKVIKMRNMHIGKCHIQLNTTYTKALKEERRRPNR